MIETPKSNHVSEKPDHIKQREIEIYKGHSALDEYRKRKDHKSKVAEKARLSLLNSQRSQQKFN